MTNKQVINQFLAQNSTRLIKSSSGNLSAQGHQLYSYDSLLAEFSSTIPVLYIDKDTSNYSVTSQRHTGLLKQAALLYWHNAYVYFSVGIGEPFEKSLGDMYENVHKLIGSYLRSRKYKEQIKANIHELIKKTKLFAKLHNLNEELPSDLFEELMKHKLL